MTRKQNIESINWNNLITSVRNQECILVLGPNIATVENNGRYIPLHQLLARRLAGKLKAMIPEQELLSDHNLEYVAKKLEDELFKRLNFNRSKARAELGKEIENFYQEFEHIDFPVYEHLAKLPFRFIINTNPDHFLASAYDDVNKFGRIQEYYHYLNPTHNNRVNIIDEEITADAPLVYNLFGSLQVPDSLIITENEQLAFLDAILQRERTATIPPSIAIQFTSFENQQFEKTFVFLGFDFNQWHLRLLMHLINRYQKQKETYALQNPQSLSELTTFFYKRNFDVQFVNLPSLEFANTFQAYLNEKEVILKSNPKLQVYLMYDSQDEESMLQLETQLAPLKRSEIIETWNEQKLLPGDTEKLEQESELMKADLIILLVTAHIFASDELYEEQLKSSLERHKNRDVVIIPILVKSCLWENSILGSLTTILPRNKKPLYEQSNLDAALKDTVKQLEGWCVKIHNRKNRKLENI